jgi:hypothetical protein
MSKTYEVYQDYLIRDVPNENLKIIVTDFINDAALTLGCKATKADVDKVSFFMASNQFNYIPVNVASTAFVRGSLGKLKNDKTTLSPRNIYDWLSEVGQEYRNHIEHKEREQTLSNPTVHFKDLTRYPLGKAICKKIDWYKSGAINSDDWDAISLRELAEMIGKDVMPTLEKFNLTDRRQ